MFFRSAAIFLLCFCSAFAYSQKKIDKDYIEPYKSGLILSFRNAFQNMGILFDSDIDSIPDLNYQPNNVSKSGIRIAYNGLGLALMFKNANYGKDPEVYGETDHFSLGLDIVARKWLLNANVFRVKGFYLPNIINPETWRGPGPPPKAIVREDVAINQFGVSYTRIFNSKKFSYRMLTNQSERQKKSAGTFLLRGNIYFTGANADTSFVPREFVEQYRAVQNFNEARFSNIILEPGYAHTFVIGERCSIHLRTLFGFGLQSRSFTDLEGTQLESGSLSYKTEFGLSLNYFLPRFFAGAGFTSEALGTRIEDVSLSTQLAQGEFYLGYRFPNAKLFSAKSALRKFNPVKRWIDGEI